MRRVLVGAGLMVVGGVEFAFTVDRSWWAVLGIVLVWLGAVVVNEVLPDRVVRRVSLDEACELMDAQRARAREVDR